MTVETVIKGWVVRAEVDGKMAQLSRRYHSEQAARDFAKLAEQQGMKRVEVKTIHGIEPRWE